MRPPLNQSVRPIVAAFFLAASVGLAAEPSDQYHADRIASRLLDPIEDLISALDGEGIKIDGLVDDQALSEQIQRAIINAATVDIRLISDANPEANALTEEIQLDQDFYQFRLTETVTYIRIGTLVDDVMGKLGLILPKPTETAQSIIFDFRFARDFNTKPLKQFEAMVESLSAHTFVVLVNSKTFGSFELMARIIENADHSILLGSETAGQPYAFKTFDLKNGFTLLIPKSTYALNNGDTIPGVACIPAIVLKSSQEYAEFKANLGNIDTLREDPGVVQAMDLVRAYRLMGQKRFQ